MRLRLRSRFDREIFALAIPALGALAADPVVSLVDTAFVGRLGAVPLGALGVASAVFAVAFFIFNFLAFGTTPLVARAVGAGNREEAGRLALTALLLAAFLGVGTALVLEAAAGPVLQVMGASAEVFDSALTYLRIRALAVPAVLVVIAGHGVFRGYQDTRTPLLVSIGLNAVNLVLDPLLIFGLDWGISGAAWATVVAQWMGAAWFLYLLLHSRRALLGIEMIRPEWSRVRSFLAVGRDLVVRTSSLLLTLTVATAVATRIGTVAVAAHQVTVQLWVFLALTVDALAVAAQAMVGRFLGSGEPELGRGAANRLLAWGLLVGLVLTAVMAALGPWLPGWFAEDRDVVTAVERVYPFVVLMQPLNALVFVWDGIVMGAADFRYLARAMLLAAVVGVALLLLVLPAGWGLAGVWWSIVAWMVARGLTMARWHLRPQSFRL